MMSAADEEPQLASLLLPSSNSSGNIKLASLNPLNNTSALIGDSFNLVKPLSSLALVPPPAALPTAVSSGSKNSSASPSPSILPPVNHFQPIHNRAPSTDIKEPASFFNKPLDTAGAASFFDKPNVTAPPVNLFATTNSKSPSPAAASILAPPVSLPSLAAPPKLATTVEQATAPPAAFPPPVLGGLSNQPSTVQPPMSLPPPPPSAAAASGSANPYSARGALNKKVYDSSVMPIANNPISPPAMAFTSTLPSTVSPPSNLFVPPPAPASEQPQQTASFQPPLTMATPTIPPPPSVNQSPPAAYNTTLPTSTSYNTLSQPINESFQMPTQAYQDQSYGQNYATQNSYAQSSYGQNSTDPQNKTMWNWLTQNKIVNTFVEKAKHGVESFVTTVDPQMKDYIHPANKPINMVAASSNMKLLHKIREQFNDAGFSKLSLSYYDANTSTQFAPQIVGHACAIQACKEKLDNTLIYLQQTQQPADTVVVSFQDFLAELSTDCWFEQAVVMFRDKTNAVDITIYTEAFPVANEDIAQLQMYTTADYPLKWSGFSCRLPEKNFNFNSSNQSTVLNYDTPDTILSLSRISHAVKSLAGLYKNKLLTLSAPK